MRKVMIFGNSGSGKSTLAKRLAKEEGLAHLDLDTLAWELASPPTRKSLIKSKNEILKFVNSFDSWVIEGCYADLLEIAKPYSSEIVFMNLPISDCIINARNRPWEPHKYESKEAQDANLQMLIDWITQYTERADTFSETSHKKLYEKYSGKKRMLMQNENT